MSRLRWYTAQHQSGTGAVHHVIPPDTDDLSAPMDVADYRGWLEAQLGGAQEVTPDYQPLTKESTRLLKEDP